MMCLASCFHTSSGDMHILASWRVSDCGELCGSRKALFRCVPLPCYLRSGSTKITNSYTLRESGPLFNALILVPEGTLRANKLQSEEMGLKNPHPLPHNQCSLRRNQSSLRKQSQISGLDLRSSGPNRKIFPDFFTNIYSSFITFMKKSSYFTHFNPIHYLSLKKKNPFLPRGSCFYLFLARLSYFMI